MASEAEAKPSEAPAVAAEEIPKETKTLFYRKFGGPEVVELGPLPVYDLADDEVLIKVHAASFNPIDYKRRKGDLRALSSETFPVRLGYDCAGIIIKVGPKVTQWSVGQEVFSRVKDAKTGTASEYIPVHESVIALKPKNFSFEEAASIPLAGLTAYQSLLRAGVTEGSSVLITGGAGGVGTLAIQLAKHALKAGRVVTTASPGAKTDLVKSLGADEVINYREEKWEEKYQGGEFDAIFDTAGDAAKAIRLIKSGGKVVSVADKPTSAEIKKIFPKLNFLISWYLDFSASSLTRAASKRGATYEYLFMRPNTEDLSKLGAFCEEGKLKPVIDSTYTLDQAAEALQKVESGRSTGKVVVKVV